MNQTQFSEAYSAEFNDSLKSRFEIYQDRTFLGLILLLANLYYLFLQFRNGIDLLGVLLTCGLLLSQFLFFSLMTSPFRLLYRIHEPLPVIELIGDTISLKRNDEMIVSSSLADIRFDNHSEMLGDMGLFRSTIPDPLPLVVVLQKARLWKFEPWAFAVGFTRESKTRWEEIFENAGVSKVEGNDDAG